MRLRTQAENRLRQLMETGSLPASQCGQAFLNLLAPLFDSGVLGWERSGPGRRLTVNDPNALRIFSTQRFPGVTLPPETGSRATSVARFRDTKAMANSEREIVSLRVWRDEAFLKDGKSIGAVAATEANGVFSFLLAPNCPYRLRNSWALVENPALFVAVEQLNLGVDAVIYGHGRISNRAVDWLADTNDPNFRLLHLPDYDPVGLSEFQRLHHRLGPQITLHLPADLEMRFARFGNVELLRKPTSLSMLAQLRRSETPAIRRVIELIDRHNVGLEQEALLI